MEHKIYTVDVVSITDEEKNKTEVGTITSENGVVTAVSNSGGQALATGWTVGVPAPAGDLMIPTTVDS
tara:strand:- start:68 stop:271 length:204 start_codon:yes stop_codon:yes gene_type:complete